MILPDSTFPTGARIPDWMFEQYFYVRAIKESGNVVLGQKLTGLTFATVRGCDLEKYVEIEQENEESSEKVEETPFEPYLIKVLPDSTIIRTGPGFQFKGIKELYKNQIYTIVAERGEWGRLRDGAGWINLSSTKKIVPVKIK